MHAWQTMFEELFAAWDIKPPYTERDYFDYLDGKKRYDGVASLLRSRDVEVPWGDPSDDPSADTVCGIGNRKNEVFSRVLRAEGIVAVPRLGRAPRRARRRRHPHRGRVELEERRRGARVRGPARALPRRDGRRDRRARPPRIQARAGRLRRGGADAGRRPRTQRRGRRRHQRRAVRRRGRVRARDRRRPRHRPGRAADGRRPPRRGGSRRAGHASAPTPHRSAPHPTPRRSPHDGPRPVPRRPVAPRRERLLAR